MKVTIKTTDGVLRHIKDVVDVTLRTTDGDFISIETKDDAYFYNKRNVIYFKHDKEEKDETGD